MRNVLKFALALVGFGADVITVTTGTVGNAGNVAADLQTYFAAKLLEVAERNTILDQFGEKVPVPSNSSKTIQFVREEKLAVSSSPTQLTEGIEPDAVGLTFNQFQATMEQYGFVVALSDLAELTAKHPVVARTMEVLAIQAQETYDYLIFNVLAANTSVYRPNGKTSNGALTASDVLAYADLVALNAIMDDNAARTFDGGTFPLVLAPQAVASLQKDATFIQSHQFQNVDAIYKGEVGTLSNLRIIKSNAPSFAPILNATSGFANKVYTGFCIGKMAYQISDLQNLRAYVAAPGGQTDVLQQKRKMGWKFAFKSVITNATWIQTIEAAGANSVNNA